jgi:hypothetical protein
MKLRTEVSSKSGHFFSKVLLHHLLYLSRKIDMICFFTIAKNPIDRSKQINVKDLFFFYIPDSFSEENILPIDSYVRKFIGDNFELSLDLGMHSAKPQKFNIVIGGKNGEFKEEVVEDAALGTATHRWTILIADIARQEDLVMHAESNDPAQRELALNIFHSISFSH